MQYVKNFLKKYPHIYSVIIGIVLLLWFNLLEYYIKTPENIIHVKLDDYIPFSRFFVIPYIFWFIYIGATMVYFFFKDKNDFLKLSTFLYAGMAICYIIYMVYPNGQDLRPVIHGEDIFTRLVQFIYATDTPTNCFPSIHVINSIAVHCGICNSDCFKEKKNFKASSLVIMILICISTVALKQHSIADVFGGIGVSAVLYPIIYKIKWEAIRERETTYL